ncbi:MAG: hypothetical protein KAU01_04715 [Candidatus Cloacimonetes bacterium]|nr:hypothetical protein [Candidatus Cloacimonadota bacterium]
MKKIIFLMLFVVLTISISFAWRNAEMEVRVFYNNQSELAKLADLHLDGDVYPNGEALLFVIPSELEMIKATGLRYKIEREDLNEFSKNFWQLMDPTREAYHTYAEIVALADSLATTFPDICEKHLFGTSVQGRELGALKISDNVSLDENEAEVMFDGGIHGDEIGCAENCIRFARDLCCDYGIDPDITYLVDNREIWIYYMVNPDGRVMDTRRNANNVDLNRDAGYMWDGWGSSTGAFSQPESKALRDATYGRQFVVHTTYHSGTEYISCPWSYRADQCPDFGHILQLAGVYSSTSGYANMQYGQGCTGMYPINGSTKDTNYGAAGAISWSMEISYAKHPPTWEIQMYYQYNVPAMLAMIEYSGYGLEGIVTDVNTDDPVTASVFINDYFPTYTDPAVGDYHKYVLPGTYDITIVANGYETQTITGITVTANSSTTTNFQLTPQDGQFAYRICSSRIPNNNTADEGDTPGVIGVPDYRNYSIGKNGWVVVDMQYPIAEGPGNDIKIYEGDALAEGYTCFVGEFIDGPWYSLGTASGTTEFDISVTGLIEAQFVKIVDDGDGLQTAPDAGFDLDAVEALEQVSGVYIALIGYEIDDSIGNGNGMIDPGETVNISVSLRNNGDVTANDLSGVFSSTSPYIVFDVDTVDFGNLEPNQTSTGIFTATFDNSTPIGETVQLVLDVSANSGTYTNTFDIAVVVGLIVEDFETNNFESFEWQFGGNANWFTTTGAYEGIYCAQSGNIGDNQNSSLYLEVDVLSAGELSFYKKVSSESGWDFLRFYVDNNEMGSWSGNVNWSQETYQITAGEHTFKWEYDKDTAVSTGSDCGWIDYIVFPPISTTPLPPPENLTATIIDYNSAILLEWGAETRTKTREQRDLLGYNVYYDGVFVAFVTETYFEFIGPFAAGDYYFEVTAVYDEGESEPATVVATVVLNPPINLDLQMIPPNFILSWDAPIRGLEYYNVYRNGELEAEGITGLMYIFTEMIPGLNIFNVTAIYSGDYESGFSNDLVYWNPSNVDDILIPINTKLLGIYPNPFNPLGAGRSPETTISYSLKEDTKVSISIYNIKGQKVRTLVNKEVNSGYHKVIWKGKDDNGRNVSTGVYFSIFDVKDDGGDFTSVKKIILLK